MQEVPSAAVGVVVHLLRRPPVRRRGAWIGPMRSESWVLDYCGWPGMSCRVGERGEISPSAQRRPQTWHLHAPNVAYYERYEHPELRKEDMWLHFALHRPWRPLAGRKFAAILDPEDRLAEYVRAMYAIQQLGRPGGELVLHGLLLAVLGELLTAQRAGGAGTAQEPWRMGSRSAGPQREGYLLAGVDAVVVRRLAAPPALAELAEALGMSVSSLAHRFRAETGLTVVERVRWLRIREARRLLLIPEAGVKTVAHRLGFSSAAYFAKVFRKVVGVLPTTYMAAARRA